MTTKDSSQAPLTPLTFQILLAVAGEDLHGYGVIKAVREASGGAVNPGTGTFYSAIHRMVSERLIEELEPSESAGNADARRRYYRITTAGRDALEADAARLKAWARAAKAHLAR